MAEYWRHLSDRPIDVDRVIAGLHVVELLESRTAYSNSTSLYFPRIESALASLPEKYWDAALAVFGSVIYIPEEFLEATWEYLWWIAKECSERDGVALSDSADNVHIMEVDWDGLGPNFARRNGLQARLNPDVHVRLPDVQRLRTALNDVDSDTPARSALALEQMHLLAKKAVWLVLTDKALSGQSLLNDIQRIVHVRDMMTAATGLRPLIYICAQIATSAAEKAILNWAEAQGITGLRFLSAIRLDEKARVGDSSCALFADEQTHKSVVALCGWFDSNVVALDRSLATFRARSTDGSLALGYNQSGLTLVDHRNTPTNSLPLLWFNATDSAAQFDPNEERPTYTAPFPRIHSRRGPEDPRWSERVQWEPLFEARFVEKTIGKLRAV